MKSKKKRKFRREGKFWVYIVECADKTYYTGYTNDLGRRINEHNHSQLGAKYLRKKLPVKLVYAQEYGFYKDAMLAEVDMKKLSRQKKISIIDGVKSCLR
ncbi:MAG: hypothetical protein COV71_03245 [Candidatus Omnitrophica bacterium CG11_big_fil_rev_8_21_14_0_20_41_12]|nr:MAG: hypothetical protein COV71_03245 [Candidatus Omnitrophica bacterium CG11_big_fil_rev_8_21_14_0_20_41_12]